jgi:hypothetical protein
VLLGMVIVVPALFAQVVATTKVAMVQVRFR